ncbi:MAG: diguanylate cyclase (GGDEF)-like protein [Alphaproteobacteria bacterium]|jgi:diguanylate cyclase (GGDEF)-like protein
MKFMDQNTFWHASCFFKAKSNDKIRGDGLMKATSALKSQLKRTTSIERGSVKKLVDEISTLRAQLEVQEGKIKSLKRQALEDPLTGLANRRAFETELKGALSFYQRYARNGAVLLIDVDAFKGINDSLGHLAGDALLKHISQVLKNHVRETDFVARIGGDEFCIILREVSSNEAQHKIAEIEAAMSTSPCSYEGKDIHISVSAGSCQFRSAKDKNELMDKADRSMYAQKNDLTLIDNS